MALYRLHTAYILFKKKVTTHKIIFQEKQEGGSVLDLTNAKGGRISLTYLGYF